MSSSDANSKAFNIAIVGGGISGLVLAIALQRKNIPFTLYEAAARFGEIGAGVAFGPNAVRSMELIDPGVKQGFDNCATHNQFESKQQTWFDYRVGDDRWKEKPGHDYEKLGSDGFFTEVLSGSKNKTVHRAHFLDEMVKLLEGDIAKFGKRLTNLKTLDNEDVELHFADGTKAIHSAVIGCDGIKSQTRKLLLDNDHPASRAVFSGKYAYRGLIPMEKAVELLGEELASNSQMYLGYHSHVLTFPVEKGKTMNVVAFASRKDWENPNWVTDIDRDAMIADFKGWGSHVHSILSLMKATTIWALFMHPPAPTYYRGRVCLLGDAAHASTPHQGAGAGMGIEDALIMQQILTGVREKEELEHAFAAFDEVRRERSQKLVTTSADCGRLYEMEKEGIEDDVAKIKENMAERMKWIWNIDLEKHIAEARKALSDRLAKSKLA